MSQAFKQLLVLPRDDEEQWLRALLELLDSGFIQIGRNTIWARLVYRYGAAEERR